MRDRSARLASAVTVALTALGVPLEKPGGIGPPVVRMAAAQVPVDVEIGASREVLSGDHEAWEDYWIRATYRPGPGTFVYGAIRYTRRFGEDDQRYEAGAGMPLGERWSARLDGSWSPTHRVAPIWGVSGTVGYRPAPGWTVSGGGGREVWDDATVTRQHLGVDRRFDRVALGYRLGLHQVDPGRSGIRHAATGSLLYGDRANRVDLRLGIGREALAVSPGEVRSTTERSARLSGIHWLDARTGISYHFGIQRHGPFFTRSTSSIGIQRRL